MRRALCLTICLCFGGLAGCATLPASQMSFADPSLSPSEAGVVARDMAAKAARTLPPAKTVLVVRPTPSAQAQLGIIVTTALRQRGFAVTELTPGAVGQERTLRKGAPFRYQITADKGLVLVRMELSDRLLARAYGRSAKDSTLHASGPWSGTERPG